MSPVPPETAGLAVGSRQIAGWADTDALEAGFYTSSSHYAVVTAKPEHREAVSAFVDGRGRT